MDSAHFKASSSIRELPATSPRIECVAIDKVQLNPRNARTHSKKQIRQIAASLRNFGFISPIVVDENYVALAGNGRLQAARLEGISHVPVIRIDHLTRAQKRAYLIADNRIAELAGWDREILAIEFGELTDLLPMEGLDISLTGFETAEIDSILIDAASSRPEPDDAPPSLPRNAVTQPAELWLLGKHRLLCGDAQESSNFTRLMDGVLAAAVFCDPPYNQKVSTIGGRGQVQHPEFAYASGEMDWQQYRKFLSRTLGNGIRVSEDGAVHFVFTDWRHVGDLTEVSRDIYGAMLNLVVWNKTNGGQGSFYRSQHELIGVFRVGDRPHRNNVELGRFGRNRPNVWTYAGVNTFGRGRMEALASHPTVKPIALVSDAILDCTARGNVVLDQFAGSGTTILAAEKVGRIAYAMEYEPRYVDVAVERWQRSTKLEATLADDGRSFEEIARLRGVSSRPPHRSSAAPLITRLAKNKTAVGSGKLAPDLHAALDSEKADD